MDVDTIKNMLSDGMPQEEFADLLPETAQRSIVLESASLEDGMTKAAMLLDVEPEEIEFHYLDGDAEKKGAGRIEFRQRLISGDIQIVVVSDNLRAYIPDLYPKMKNGSVIEAEYIFELLRAREITTGIKSDVIDEAVKKAVSEKIVMKDIVVAECAAPGAGKEAQLLKGVFGEKGGIDYKADHGLSVADLFEKDSIEEIEENAFPAFFVNKGDVVAVTTFPGGGKSGVDIFGGRVEPAGGGNMFNTGKNVKFEFADQKVVYTALGSGYLDLRSGVLDVVSPIHITEDRLGGFFLKLPLKNKIPVLPDIQVLNELIESAGINKGIVAGFAKNISAGFENNKEGFAAIPVALGKKPVDGEDARIEIFFSKEEKSGVVRLDGSIDFHERIRKDQVKTNQLLAAKFLSTGGTTGWTIDGETLSAKKGIDAPFDAYNNVRIVESDEKLAFYSTMDGIADLVGDHGVGVNKHFDVAGDVDLNTGNIAFDGNVDIAGSVQPGFTVVADGNVSIGGSVGQKVTIESGGNVTVNEGIVGKRDINITAKGVIKAKFIQGADIESGSDVIVRESIINSVVMAMGGVYTPAKTDGAGGKGSVIESDITALYGIAANIVGSDASKDTKLAAGIDYSYDKKMEDLKKAKNYCEFEIHKISKALRMGVNEVAKIKLLIKKLPPVKQKPFIDAFKKMISLNNLRLQVMEKIEKLQTGIANAAFEAAVVVRRQMFPNVLIQVGEKRLKTDGMEQAVRFALDPEDESMKKSSV